MLSSYSLRINSVHQRVLIAATLSLMVIATTLRAQSVPAALESPAAQPPQSGPHGEKLPGMPKFHDPAPYDIDEHSGYKQIFDCVGCSADDSRSWLGPARKGATCARSAPEGSDRHSRISSQTHAERKAMSTLRFFSSVRNIETITCQHCKRPQYPRGGVCIACNAPLPFDI